VLYDESAAAKELGLSPTTLRIWRQRDKGPPYFKLGDRVLYATEDLTRWLMTKRIVPGRTQETKSA
jgi:DNA-binding transcriptional MerR regulator